MITFCKALNGTMKIYGIRGIWIAEQSGLSHQSISAFLNGRSQIKADSLERIIEILPPDAQEHFFQQLRPINKDLRSLILKASDDEKAEVLRLIAASLTSGIMADRKEAVAV
jgi:transcriptional regulator with XRE-family HTH domain